MSASFCIYLHLQDPIHGLAINPLLHASQHAKTRFAVIGNQWPSRVKGGWCNAHEADCGFADNIPVLRICHAVHMRCTSPHEVQSCAQEYAKHYQLICSHKSHVLISNSSFPVAPVPALLHPSSGSLPWIQLAPGATGTKN